MSAVTPLIVWFRHDLRLADNPALYQASVQGAPIIPVFIYDPDIMDRDYGAAQKVWLHHALHSLRADFQKKGIDFLIRRGDSALILNDLIDRTKAGGVYWNRSYEQWSINRDSHIKADLKARNLDVQSFKANLLFEPWEVKNGSGSPYKVFTPYYKKCLEQAEVIVKAPLRSPPAIMNGANGLDPGLIEALNFLPAIAWDKDLVSHWDISEDGAWNRLKDFFDHGLGHYKDGRDIPSCDYTSRLSPYLRWGMISPRSIWHETQTYAVAHNVAQAQSDFFLRELCWREFCYHLLYTHPVMKDTPLQEKFKNFPWKKDDTFLQAWQKGMTGYPLVDAGMRQLWQTGWMHNRVRMIVGSFLVKHLLQPWQDGETWFWDTLVDADPANNSCGWQWIGGCGADAAPYFRVFNPITQGDKFDAYAYVRKYVPEIAALPDKYLFSPWEFTAHNSNYPKPIISHQDGRNRALAAFESLKEYAELT